MVVEEGFFTIKPDAVPGENEVAVLLGVTSSADPGRIRKFRAEPVEALHLGPEAQAVLRYVRKNGTTTQQRCAYHAGLPESHVHQILWVFARTISSTSHPAMRRSTSASRREVRAVIKADVRPDSDLDTALELLKAHRRRLAIEHIREYDDLAESDEPATIKVKELAKDIAADEFDTERAQLGRNQYRSVENALRQVHLPKLRKHGIVKYHDREQTVTATDLTDEAGFVMAGFQACLQRSDLGITPTTVIHRGNVQP